MRTPIVAALVVGVALWGAAANAGVQDAANAGVQDAASAEVQDVASAGVRGAAGPAPQRSQPVPAFGAPPTPKAMAATYARAASPQRYSADGLYNLANSYARAGKLGMAVLNYERASLLAPNDADINANLEYVQAAAHVPTEPRGRLASLALAVTPAMAAWIGVVGVGLVGIGLLGRRLAPRRGWLWGGGAFVGVAFAALTVANGVLLWPRLNQAVVLVSQAPARVSPVPMGDAAFVLREAETVAMTAQHEEFVLVRTRTGQSGWVARASLGAVVP